MPLYTFQCVKCEYVFEELVSMEKSTKVKCCKCTGKTKKYVGHSSFILKGTGWAKDGYTGNPSGTIGPDPEKPAVRVPIISDKKTGKKIGTGKPELI